MRTPLTRRNALRVGGLAIAAGLAGCSSDTAGSPTTTSTTTTRSTKTTSGRRQVDHAAWAYDLGGEAALPPTLVDGTLFAGRADGQFVALDPTSGDETWSTDAGEGFFSGFGGFGATPTVSDGRIYLVSGAQAGVAGRGFKAVALDAETGEERWTHSVDETSFLTLLGVRDGHVLVATNDDLLANGGEELLSLDPATGDVQWTAETGDPSKWGIGAGGVYVTAHQGMRAVALEDGTPRWSKQERVESPVNVAADTVVLSLRRNDEPRLLGLEPAAGDVRWEGPEWRVTSHAISTDDVVYAGGEQIGAFDAATGEQRWAIEGSGTIISPPIGGRLFARLDGGIHARDPTSGDFVWGTNATIDGGIAFGESLVAYVASVDDPAVPPTLVARSAATGEPAFAITLDDIEGLTPPVVRSETVYTATRAGRVYAFKR